MPTKLHMKADRPERYHGFGAMLIKYGVLMVRPLAAKGTAYVNVYRSTNLEARDSDGKPG